MSDIIEVLKSYMRDDLNLANFDSLDRIHRYIEMCKA
jgi:hypothetical protein